MFGGRASSIVHASIMDDFACLSTMFFDANYKLLPVRVIGPLNYQKKEILLARLATLNELRSRRILHR